MGAKELERLRPELWRDVGKDLTAQEETQVQHGAHPVIFMRLH